MAAKDDELTGVSITELDRIVAGTHHDPHSVLGALMIDKAVYEVIYEARHRPSWQSIPLSAIAGMQP